MQGELLVPDAPDLVERLLKGEQDLSTRRNAFAMLAAHAQVGRLDSMHCGEDAALCRGRGPWPSYASASAACSTALARAGPAGAACKCGGGHATQLLCLLMCSPGQDKAVAYLISQIERVADWGDILQVRCRGRLWQLEQQRSSQALLVTRACCYPAAGQLVCAPHAVL